MGATGPASPLREDDPLPGVSVLVLKVVPKGALSRVAVSGVIREPQEDRQTPRRMNSHLWKPDGQASGTIMATHISRFTINGSRTI